MIINIVGHKYIPRIVQNVTSKNSTTIHYFPNISISILEYKSEQVLRKEVTE
jgi:hypothetical protein